MKGGYASKVGPLGLVSFFVDRSQDEMRVLRARFEFSLESL